MPSLNVLVVDVFSLKSTESLEDIMQAIILVVQPGGVKLGLFVVGFCMKLVEFLLSNC